jgi:RNA polymerase sigma factor for flagellar operon FliA
MGAMETSKGTAVIGREHLRIVHAIARKLAGRSLDHDELVSAGMLGLVQAAQSYDGSRVTTFSSWAYRRIFGAMVDELRSAGEHTRGEVARYRAGLPTRRKVSLGALREMADARGEPVDETLSRMREFAVVRAAVRRLEPRSRKIIEGYYFEGRAQDEIADGAHKSWACRLLSRAEGELRELLGAPAPQVRVSRARRRA